MPEDTPNGSLKLGIVGLGYIGSVVGEQFARHPDAEIVAVCDLNDERLATIGERFGVDPARRYLEDDRLFAEAPIDAVLIGTPHTLHHDQVRAALDRDLHVYCDKPLTTDLEDARDLTHRAREASTTVMVGYQRHLQTAFKTARERYRPTDDQGREPTWLTASITQPWIADSAGTWRLDPVHSGGGFLYDTGSHVLDAVLWTTGLVPESVRASMDFHDDQGRVDSRAHLDVTFEGGATGTISLNGDAVAVREHIHCWDDEGAVYLEGKQWRSRKVFEVDTESGEYHPYIDHQREQTRAGAFLEAVREGNTPQATPEDALAVTALTEAAYESARRGERVTVEGLEAGR